MKLKEIRLRKGLTQAQVAEMIGVHVMNISRWENGERDPSTDIVRKLAFVLECTTDELLGVVSN